VDGNQATRRKGLTGRRAIRRLAQRRYSPDQAIDLSVDTGLSAGPISVTIAADTELGNFRPLGRRRFERLGIAIIAALFGTISWKLISMILSPRSRNPEG
jgi:hypothetical protein